jgi:hypothetical protein
MRSEHSFSRPYGTHVNLSAFIPSNELLGYYQPLLPELITSVLSKKQMVIG